jgi:uncharacterized RDD family membrane protein YckC
MSESLVATALTAEPMPAPPILRRIAALPYEGLLLLALVLIASFPIAGLKGAALVGTGHVIYQAWLVVVTGAYFIWQWQKSGQTLAMKTWRFRVVSQKNGATLRWRHAGLRFVVAALFFGPACVGILLLFFPTRLSPLVTAWFFFPLMATLLYARFDGDKQFLHDRIARTRLVDAR